MSEERMKYKGYSGMYGFEDGLYFGRVTGIQDVVTFAADDEKDIETVFRESVDDYLEMCASRKEEPLAPSQP